MRKLTVDDIQNMSMEQYANMREMLLYKNSSVYLEEDTNSYVYYRQQYVNTGNEDDLERMLEHVETDTTPGC